MNSSTAISIKNGTIHPTDIAALYVVLRHSTLFRIKYIRYKENVVASTLGLPLDAPLSHDEWKSIRRRCKLVPRRFSKQFIASELTERNKYRSIIRSVQDNQYLRPPKYRYNVYKPLSPGTLVKAYCKMGLMIQNGTVVSYDPTCARYLIEFEDERYGHEYCPDSDVACRGKPRVLFPGYDYDCHGRFKNGIGELQGMYRVIV